MDKIERKKTERKINQIEKQLKEENDSEKKKELQVKLEEFKLNMLYIRVSIHDERMTYTHPIIELSQDCSLCISLP